MPEAINLAQKFAALKGPWAPEIVAELNGQLVKVVRFEGEFIWHHHVDEDELFLVISGRLRLRFRDGDVLLGPGEICVVPRGVEHQPVAEPACQVVLFEPLATRRTGNVDLDRTVDV